MTPEAANIAIKECLKAIRERLEEAAAIAKAADACAQAGTPDKAVTIVLDVEQMVYEVDTFLKRRKPHEPLLRNIGRLNPLVASPPASASGLRGDSAR
jgi:hypothetical protein